MSLDKLIPVLWQGVLESLWMTLPSTLLAYLVGMPLGILLVVTGKGHIMENPKVNAAVGAAVNFLRSIPFIILLALLFPVTRLVMRTAVGTTAIIFPLFVCAFPYVARMVESSLLEVNRGVIEAAQAMGSTNRQIILNVMLREALPSLLQGATICLINILGYSAMASAAGGGGLGSLAITKGLNQRNMLILYSASLTLVAMVQILNVAGNRLTKRFDHRKN